MKLIDRYVLKEFFLPLAFGLCLFLFALVMNRLFDLLDLVFNRGISVGTVAQLLLALIPSIVAVVLPMATLLASILAFGRFAADRELLAVRSAGMSLWRMAAPLAAVGLVFSGALLVFNGTLMPDSNMFYKKVFFSIVKQRATVAFKERVFVREFDKYLLYFNDKEDPAGIMKDVYILELPSGAGIPPRLITAERGNLLVDTEGMRVKMVLENGVMDQPADMEGRNYSRIEFGSYEIDLNIHEALAGGRLFVKGLTEMTYGDLLQALAKVRNVPEQRRPFDVELNQRIALAFAPFFVILIGVPLGALAKRGGGVGVVLSLIVIFIYYVLLTMGRGFAERGDGPAALILWAPNAFMAVVGFLAFWAATHEARWIRWGR